jgi:hypothetical protein
VLFARINSATNNVMAHLVIALRQGMEVVEGNNGEARCRTGV